MVETRSKTRTIKPAAKTQEVHKKTEIDNKKAKKSEKKQEKLAKEPKSQEKKVSESKAPPKTQNKSEKPQPEVAKTSKSEKKKDKTQPEGKILKKTPRSTTKIPTTTNKSPSPPPSSEPVQKVKSIPKKYAMYDIDQYKKFLELENDLNKNGLSELKDMCRKNLMKVSGNKSDVIERIADAKILGVIPKCPACGGGRPKLNPKTMTYYCSGYLEDVDFINCHKSFKYSDIVRTQWQD
ncbi:hypothetical protein SteCoe_32404 [Stentor coeruleus]|uniref:PARP1-like PADR1 domain-containing protein n=1 Tax=Stentor coeruleus TaxID=5963 RepID=A0A1R2AZ72_9CILI|nr:hypothetical protein SteCoe_32404 [Stentor coeruleus]